LIQAALDCTKFVFCRGSDPDPLRELTSPKPPSRLQLGQDAASCRDAESAEEPVPGSGGARNFQFGGLKPGPMASAWSVSLYGGLGAEPPAGSRGRAPGGRSGGQSPPEAESSLAFGRPSD